MNAEALSLGRSLLLGGGGGAHVRYGTVKQVGEGRATVSVDGGTVEAPAMTCVPADASGKRCVVLVDGSSATVLGVIGEGSAPTPEVDLGVHVVETGEANGWTWRKWSDGTAECWKAYEVVQESFNTAYGNVWFMAYTSALPFAFAEKPMCWGSVQSHTGGILNVSFNSDTTESQLGFYVSSAKTESRLNFRVNLHASGRVGGEQ